MKRYSLYACIFLALIGCKKDDDNQTDPVDILSDSTVGDTTADTSVPGEEREPCANKDPLRQLFFGDLHVHTQQSFDAWVYDIRSTPEEAYAFAKGETILLPPLDKDGKGTRPAQLARPLDFAAVTDHAELLAETTLCSTPGSLAYDTETCQQYRQPGGEGISALAIELADPNPERYPELCGNAGDECAAIASDLWSQTQQAAETWYDRSSACTFTTFVAYEYSAATNVSNLHRNVIFRNASVPPLPISYFEAPTPKDLWESLKSTCIEGDPQCDVLAIPHNSNLSNGNMFAPIYPGAETIEDEVAQATLRAELEPLVEMFQHKGDMECLNGFDAVLGGEDELCDFEKLFSGAFQDCKENVGAGGMAYIGCLSRWDFVRYALIEGIAEQNRIGINPYKMGFIGGTDTHSATPGAVDESNFMGHTGSDMDEPEEFLSGSNGFFPGGARDSTGGLMAVWAEENTRDAIFDAMKRRETYATSGPRIALRFFGAWDYEPGLCGQSDWLATADAAGVPMGGDLPPAPASQKSPTFVVSAMMDGGTQQRPGVPLQRLQIIKGWADEEGQPHQQIYEVAGSPENGASVDLNTCAPTGDGHSELCAVWTDPDFDPAVRAMYYARVVENPSCRHTAWRCLEVDNPESYYGCTAEDLPKTIQERAWSSPIWYDGPS